MDYVFLISKLGGNMKSTSTSHIRGATFSRAGNVILPAGIWAASGNIKTQEGTLVSALNCTLTALGVPDSLGNTHSLLFVVAASSTSTWPIDTLVADITFTDSTVPLVPVVIKTSRFNISVQPEV